MSNVHEQMKRANKVLALTAALPAVAEKVGMKPLDLLDVFTDESWGLLSQLAAVNPPSSVTRQAVRAHFQAAAALQAQLTGKLQVVRKTHKFNVENL